MVDIEPESLPLLEVEHSLCTWPGNNVFIFCINNLESIDCVAHSIEWQSHRKRWNIYKRFRKPQFRKCKAILMDTFNALCY